MPRALTKTERAWLAMLAHECGADAVIEAVATPVMAPPATVGGICQLTPRERDAFVAYAQGRQVKEIAREVGMSVNNVKGRLMSARSKLGVRNRVEAVALVAHARPR